MEATLMSPIPGLTNMVGGWGGGENGAVTFSGLVCWRVIHSAIRRVANVFVEFLSSVFIFMAFN